jgi:hypothetical protein
MAFSSLTLTRSDINAFEGETFRDLNVTGVGTTLNLSLTDTLVLDKAKSELQTDILDSLQVYVSDGTYASETALLDALYDADDQDLLKNTLVYKFLELWFYQDATNEDSFAYQKAGHYYQKYSNYVKINIKRLSGGLATPKIVPRMRMRSSYGY